MANGRNQRGKGRARAVKLFERDGIRVSYEGGLADAIRNLSAGIKKEVLRPAAYAGARIMYDGMRRVVPVHSGDLYGAIYHWHDDKRSSDALQVYWIGPNKAKAPHWFNVEYGHWRYNKIIAGRAVRSKSRSGSRVSAPGVMDRSVHDLSGALAAPVWVPARPYIRVTYDQNITAALGAMKRRAGDKLRELMRSQ